MNSIETTENQTGTHDSRRMRLSLILLGGLLIGLAASLPLGIALPYPDLPPAGSCIYGTGTNPVERIRLAGVLLPLPCMPTFMFIQPVVWGSFLAAEAVFGLIAYRLAGRGSQILAALLGGFSFLVASFIGSQVVTRLPAPELPVFFSSSTADPFAIMVFGLSLTFALAIGLALRTRGLLWRAFAAATLTAMCYWLVAWILLGHAVMIWSHDATTPPLVHNLPDFGRPIGPMMKTTLISNLIAGMFGGWVTLILLTVRRANSGKPV